MTGILTSDSVPEGLLSELRAWFEAEWGRTDPFEGIYPDVSVPMPIVAVAMQSSLIGGLCFTSAAKPRSADIGIWINMLVVLPDYRRQGIASKLIRSAEFEAGRLGVRELFVLTAVPRLYQKLGWRIVEMNTAEGEVILTKTL